jgi:hypothetical protein
MFASDDVIALKACTAQPSATELVFVDIKVAMYSTERHMRGA